MKKTIMENRKSEDFDFPNHSSHAGFAAILIIMALVVIGFFVAGYPLVATVLAICFSAIIIGKFIFWV